MKERSVTREREWCRLVIALMGTSKISGADHHLFCFFLPPLLASRRGKYERPVLGGDKMTVVREVQP